MSVSPHLPVANGKFALLDIPDAAYNWLVE